MAEKAMATHPPVIVVEIVGTLMATVAAPVRSTQFAALCWRRIWLCAFGRCRFWPTVKRRL